MHSPFTQRGFHGPQGTRCRPQRRWQKAPRLMSRRRSSPRLAGAELLKAAQEGISQSATTCILTLLVRNPALLPQCDVSSFVSYAKGNVKSCSGELRAAALRGGSAFLRLASILQTTYAIIVVTAEARQIEHRMDRGRGVAQYQHPETFGRGRGRARSSR